jgi:hypothetical protein
MAAFSEAGAMVISDQDRVPHSTIYAIEALQRAGQERIHDHLRLP